MTCACVAHHSEALGIRTFGISVTSLEEVFLRLAEVVEEGELASLAARASSR